MQNKTSVALANIVNPSKAFNHTDTHTQGQFGLYLPQTAPDKILSKINSQATGFSDCCCLFVACGGVSLPVEYGPNLCIVRTLPVCSITMCY